MPKKRKKLDKEFNKPGQQKLRWINDKEAEADDLGEASESEAEKNLYAVKPLEDSASEGPVAFREEKR